MQGIWNLSDMKQLTANKGATPVIYYDKHFENNLRCVLIWNLTNYFAVIATMPGYRSKSTRILLGEEAMTVDFVLDPEIDHGESLLRQGCDSKNRLKLLEFFPRFQLEVFYLVVIIILAFLCFLMKRRVTLNFLKHRKPFVPKGSVVV